LSTLVDLFDQQREQLRQRLSGELNPEQVVREVKTTLSTLLAMYGQEKTHSLGERRLSGFLLDTVTAAASALTACEVAVSERERSSSPRSFSRPAERGGFLLRGVQIALAAVLVGMLYQMEAFSSLILLFVLMILTVREWFLKAPTSSVSSLAPVEPPQLRINSTMLLTKLREAIRAADTTLADAIQPAPLAASPLEENVALLDFFQELLRASSNNDGVFALKQVTTLAFLLEQQGIKAVNFTKEHAPFFDTVPNLDPGIRTWLTVKPALTKQNGKLLKRGLAAEPVENKQPNTPTR